MSDLNDDVHMNDDVPEKSTCCTAECSLFCRTCVRKHLGTESQDSHVIPAVNLWSPEMKNYAFIRKMILKNL